VPVGAFLSGGIDSALVVALMCREIRDVRTFTIGFEDRAYDESADARAIASHLGTSHTEIMVSESDMEALIKDLPGCYEEPFADASAIPTMALSRLTRQHVTVALSGDGGDELFCGYPYYRYMQKLDPWRHSLSGMAGLWRMMSQIVPHKAAMGMRAISQQSSAALFAYMRGPLKSRDYAWLVPGLCIEAAQFMEGSKESGQVSMRAYMDLDLRTYLPDDILVKVDRATMSVGLEARTPYLDYRFVEATMSLPDQLRAQPGKPLLKSLLSRHLPASLFERPKHGFTVPIRKWLRTGLRQSLTDAVEAGELVSSGFVDRQAARTLLREHVSGSHNHENMLWALLCFQKWFERSHG
jgi:asparagine synthase (glutamine-hydrolysing)